MINKNPGYCAICNKLYDQPHNCVGKQIGSVYEHDKIVIELREVRLKLEKNAWNEAIETAALVSEINSAANIRKLKEMSVKELIINDAPIYFKFRKADNIEGAIRITTYFGEDCPRADACIDRSQAHLLMLYLQEHLK